VSEPHRTLQAFMVDRRRAGMLLCLCSKNMKRMCWTSSISARHGPKREHLVARRINWNSKSDNIKSLAHELNLGWTASSLSMTTRWSAPMFASTAPAS